MLLSLSAYRTMTQNVTAAVIEVNIWMTRRLEDVAGQQWLSSVIKMMERAYTNRLIRSQSCAST